MKTGVILTRFHSFYHSPTKSVGTRFIASVIYQWMFQLKTRNEIYEPMINHRRDKSGPYGNRKFAGEIYDTDRDAGQPPTLYFSGDGAVIYQWAMDGIQRRDARNHRSFYGQGHQDGRGGQPGRYCEGNHSR